MCAGRAREKLLLVGCIIILCSKVTSCPIPTLNNGAPVVITGGPGLSCLTRETRINLIHAITPKLGPNSSITGVDILNFSPVGCCANEDPLRTTSVKVSVTPDSISLHYGLIALSRSSGPCRRGAVRSCYTSSVSARRTTRLVGTIRRGFKGSAFRFCPNISCERYLV